MVIHAAHMPGLSFGYNIIRLLMETNKLVFGSIKQMLTRDQMRQIKGGSGNACYSGCSCSGMTGTWVYTNGCASQSQAGSDIATYCRYGGSCTQA